MSIWVGTSGYNYPEWKGSFYPETLPAAKMLPYYAERLSTVEINYTFYRMPTASVVDGWSRATPERYAITLKAPKRITHDARLRNCEAAVREFLEAAGTLGGKLGALLFQLPPNLKKDVARLDAFVTALPPHARAAFEFRHPSWFDDDVYEVLRRRQLALCIADSETLSTPLVRTGSFGYYRLRDEGYTPADLSRWASHVREDAVGGREVFVYFKHEEAGRGPEFARALLELLRT